MRRERGAIGVGLGIALGVLGLIAVIALVLGLRWAFAPATGAVQQREQTVGSGAYRISAYDRFFDDCNAAKTTQQNLTAAQHQLDEATKAHADAGRLMQLQANVTALTATLNGQVNAYNADAAKTDTRGHFRASDLPYTLDADQEITCSR